MTSLENRGPRALRVNPIFLGAVRACQNVARPQRARCSNDGASGHDDRPLEARRPCSRPYRSLGPALCGRSLLARRGACRRADLLLFHRARAHPPGAVVVGDSRPRAYGGRELDLGDWAREDQSQHPDQLRLWPPPLAGGRATGDAAPLGYRAARGRDRAPHPRLPADHGVRRRRMVVGPVRPLAPARARSAAPHLRWTRDGLAAAAALVYTAKEILDHG